LPCLARWTENLFLRSVERGQHPEFPGHPAQRGTATAVLEPRLLLAFTTVQRAARWSFEMSMSFPFWGGLDIQDMNTFTENSDALFLLLCFLHFFRCHDVLTHIFPIKKPAALPSKAWAMLEPPWSLRLRGWTSLG
jgi:hypothetical protein